MNEKYETPKLVEKANQADNFIGFEYSPITIVEYGDYDCKYCAYFSEVIQEIIKDYAGKVRFVFRHFPLTSIHPTAELAARASEAAAEQGKFWQYHQTLFDHRDHSKEALIKYAEQLDLDIEKFKADMESEKIEQRIQDDFEKGLRSGVNGTPTIFINDRRYDGAWDRESILEFIQQPPGIKLERIAKRFTDQAVSGGILLFFFTILALIIANSPFSEDYFATLKVYFDLSLGDFEILHESVIHMINDGLMAIFFFLVGLEIKREMVSGELSDPSKASLPIIAALGGAVIPAGLYLLVNIGNPGGFDGFGIPMATDIAFLLVILTFLDSRIPSALRVFFSALAIVDDILAILIISVFYTEQLYFNNLIYAAIILGMLFLLNIGKIYTKLPYLVLGILLWWFVLHSGVHATVAGVVVAMTIPTRKAPDTKALIAQCSSLLDGVKLPEKDMEDLRHSTVQTLESITQRIQSPLEAIEHDIQPWTTYAILPIFALANAGIALSGVTMGVFADPIVLGIILGLVIGKPLGIVGFTWIAVKMGIADLPSQVSWKMLLSTSWLAGIGFTMSLFISNLAFSDDVIISKAKFAILIASALATAIGLGLGFYYNEEIGQKQSQPH